MQRSCLTTWPMLLLVSLAFAAPSNSVISAGDRKPDPKLAKPVALVKKLGGAVHIVDGQVHGICFESDEIFVVGDAPNEVINPTVTDETLAVIKFFPNLKSLILNWEEITDKGMVHIAALRNLEELWLGYSAVTERGLVHLKHCRHLKKLELWSVKLSATGLRPLTSNMTLANTLAELDLLGCTFSDGGAAALSCFSSLRELRLTGTNISDDDVPHLAKLTDLTEIYLNSTPVSSAGVAALQRALPKAKIITEDPAP